jgi:hypothetical protein
MRKVIAVSAVAIALVSVMTSTVLAAAGSGIRPSGSVSTLAAGSGIRPD